MEFTHSIFGTDYTVRTIDREDWQELRVEDDEGACWAGEMNMWERCVVRHGKCVQITILDEIKEKIEEMKDASES